MDKFDQGNGGTIYLVGRNANWSLIRSVGSAGLNHCWTEIFSASLAIWASVIRKISWRGFLRNRCNNSCTPLARATSSEKDLLNNNIMLVTISTNLYKHFLKTQYGMSSNPEDCEEVRRILLNSGSIWYLSNGSKTSYWNAIFNDFVNAIRIRKANWSLIRSLLTK